VAGYVLLQPAPIKAQQKDSLDAIFLLKDKVAQQNAIIQLLYNRYLFSSTFDTKLAHDIKRLRSHQTTNAEGLILLAKAFVFRRKNRIGEAEKILANAIASIEPDQSRLLYNLHLNKGFLHADKGELPDAIKHYRLAHNEAKRLGNKVLNATSLINIADCYLNLQLFNQSLRYLEEALALSNDQGVANRMNRNYVYLNKAEIFFMLKNKDSLDYYRHKLNIETENIYDLQRTQLRLRYYSLILAKQFEQAIPIIRALIKTDIKYHQQVENINLAECYYQIGKIDSARLIGNMLIKDPMLVSPSLKIRVYQLLAKISEDGYQYDQSLAYHKMALSESERYNKGLMIMGDVSLKFRLEQMKAAYEAKVLIYKKEHTILLFAMAILLLIAIIAVILYQGIKQKRRYEKLLAQTKNQELAFINSHEVRKHLANILGLSNTIYQLKPSDSDLSTFLNHLHNSAKDLDECVRNMQNKLKE
jgi:tetratricopeptide (TPR) repeat protein